MKHHLLPALLALCAITATSAHACCALGRPGEPVVNADQTVLLIWDPQTKTEHFIRKASFKSEGGDFGFLVPTPTRPQLSESGNEAFPHLAALTRPRHKPSVGFGCSASTESFGGARSAVTVIERKEVAGFDAVVLSASSASALTGWLQKNGFHFSPEVEAWAAPYVRDGWMLTALRVAKRTQSDRDTTVRADALRITFHTERPLFPYREPDSREAARKVGASSRLLRLYFISDARYDGALDGTHSWSGKPVWSNALLPSDKQTLLGLLKLPPTSGPERWWLTEFEDRWPYGIAPGDLYFTRSHSQKPVQRWAYTRPTTDVSLAVCFAMAGLVLLRRKHGTTHTAPRMSPRSVIFISAMLLFFGGVAFGEDDAAALKARDDKAIVLAKEGKLDDAEKDLRAVLEIRRRDLGPEHPDTLLSLHYLATVTLFRAQFAEAEKEIRPVLALRERILGPEHADTLKTRNNLAAALANQSKFADAEKELRTVLAGRERTFGAEHHDTLECRDSLASLLHGTGKYAEAEKEYRTILAIRERTLGAEHDDTLEARHQVAMMLDDLGKPAEAEKEFRAVMAIRRRLLGPEDAATLVTWSCITATLNNQTKYAEGEKECRALLAIQQRVRGPEHPDTLNTRNNLAVALQGQGRNAEAEKEHRAMLILNRRIHGPEHPETLKTWQNLAAALQLQGKYAEAEKECRALLPARERVLGPEHPDTMMTRNNLAATLAEQGKSEQATAEFRTITAILERTLGPEHPKTLQSRANIAASLGREEKYAEAEKELRPVLAIRERLLGPDHPLVIEACLNLAASLGAQGKRDEALPLARRGLEHRTKTLGEKHRATREARKLVDQLEKPTSPLVL